MHHPIERLYLVHSNYYFHLDGIPLHFCNLLRSQIQLHTRFKIIGKLYVSGISLVGVFGDHGRTWWPIFAERA